MERDSSDDKLSALWQAACIDYANETGKPLGDVALTGVQGPEDLSRHLDAEKDNFEDFRAKRRPLLHAMQTVIAPFETWASLVAVTQFPPASTIMGAMVFLIQGTKKRLGHFALRLESYKGVPLSEGMKVIIVKVLVNFLRVCAASQKLVNRGSLKVRLAKWAKTMLLEDGEISGLLSELEELTSQEHMMVSAHGLKITHQALRNTEELLKRDSQRYDRERLHNVKATLNPVSGSSQVFSSINENRMPGSGAWVEDRLRSWLKRSEPILWLHGGPGVGKSYIVSKIITEISRGALSTAPAPVVASFFCRNNDVDLRSINKALRTLAWQVVTQRDDFAAHAEEFCLKEDPENSYSVWRNLLLGYLTDIPAQGTCFVLTVLTRLSPRSRRLCSLLGKIFSEDDIRPTPLRIIILSRDSVRGLLDEHSLAWIEEIEVGNYQNKDDLSGYVAEKHQKTKTFRGSSEFQEEIVSEICMRAEGLWEWANLVIKSVLRCRTKEQIRKFICSMPPSDEVAGGAGSGEDDATQLNQLKIILSFVTLAQKPLKVTQLELILEIVFKEEFLGLDDDLRTTYSSLFLLQPDTDPDIVYSGRPPEVVILRHSSFYDVNVERTKINFLYVLLCALHDNRLPTTKAWTGGLRYYAESFMHAQFMHAIPESAGRLHGEISTMHRLVYEKHIAETFRRVLLLPRRKCNQCRRVLAWCTGHEVINRRAERTMQWLLPEVKEAFRQNAQASTVASDLEPVEIRADDGMPGAIPIFLRFYTDMVTAYTTKQGSRENELTGFRLYHADVLGIFAAAELQKQERTPFWHARVGQALLLNCHYREAREQFQFALQSHAKNPTYGAPSLSALEHHELSEQLARGTEEAQESDDEPLEQVCNRARLKHRAGRTDDAVEMADRAWRRAIEKDNWWPSDFEALFSIFMELHQPQRLKPYVLTPDDNEHLDRLAVAMKKLSTDQWNPLNDPTRKYLFATFFFSKGRIFIGLDGWCQVASSARSIGHLGTVCLEQPEIPPSELCPLELDSDEKMDEVSLVLSTWLRKRGYLTNAREVLRGRVKHCIALLSDDSGFLDKKHAYMTLFKTFVTDPDSNDDCEAALYLLKEVSEGIMSMSNTLTKAKEANVGAARGSSEPSKDSKLANEKVNENANGEYNEDDERLSMLVLHTSLDECLNCRKDQSIHFWYFCRTCPYSTLCRRCYHELKGRPHPAGLFRTCTSEHEFFYTGGLLRLSQLVDEGMVPLVSRNGARQTIWVKEWKDKLAEKWRTKDFEIASPIMMWSSNSA
ncbi:hypothetical protein BDV09DRAFT_204202 [Aspergillus tetrazonus]